jgi:dipeptidyl aminopeptidase/acylaminoacyl peptidase
MSIPNIAPYGSWKSPLTADLIASKTIRLVEVKLDGTDVYWSEMRPAESGRYVVVRRGPDSQITDLTPPPFNARTRVHEYGGGAFTVADSVVYFSNFADQRLYRQRPGQSPEPVTPAGQWRYADGIIDRQCKLMFCIREDHTQAEREATNAVVSINLATGGTQVLVSGNDFYASPRLNPEGTQLAWLTWNHPNMPWHGTELWLAEVKADGSLGSKQHITGGVGESIFQPQWSPDGTLYFISDRTDWWNIYRWTNGQVEAVTALEAEFGVPQWVFGLSTYGFAPAGRIICTYTQDGVWHLARLDTTTGELEPIAIPYTEIDSLQVGSGRVVFKTASPTTLSALVQLDLATGQLETLRRSSELTVDEGYLSVPQAIEFPTENGLTAHAFFYPPKNRDYTAPADERPPLLVVSHGGPTGATSSSLSLERQYWTSRGFAVVDVNYGGSTGYGRAYRERLAEQWGVVDIDDCINAARYLVKQGEVDSDRLAIRGGSAGGYTTLCALTFRDAFHAGASHFGVSDLEALTLETHKFESRYLDWLIGPYPEQQDRYWARSPIHHAHQIARPVIFFQGLEDEVVPPSQAETLVEALRHNEIPVAYVSFAGEQHGFRRAENIKRALEGELYFYSCILGFELAEPIEPVEIDNL